MIEDFYGRTNWKTISFGDDWSSEEPVKRLQVKSHGCDCCSDEKTISRKKGLELVDQQIADLNELREKLEALENA
jgi:hypothetical protein